MIIFLTDTEALSSSSAFAIPRSSCSVVPSTYVLVPEKSIDRHTHTSVGSRDIDESDCRGVKIQSQHDLVSSLQRNASVMGFVGNIHAVPRRHLTTSLSYDGRARRDDV